MKVTCHDPCHLGRQGETSFPWDGQETKIFGQAVVYIRRDLVTMAPSACTNLRATCCARSPPGTGGDGTHPRSCVVLRRRRCRASGIPGLRRLHGGKRLDEAQSTGADAIATACPSCNKMLEQRWPGDGAP